MDLADILISILGIGGLACLIGGTIQQDIKYSRRNRKRKSDKS